MVRIRLSRTGAKKRPFYHIVIKDKRASRDGRFIENVGYFNPICDKGIPLEMKLDRIDYWLSQGAQATDTVKSLIKKYRKARLAQLDQKDESSDKSAA